MPANSITKILEAAAAGQTAHALELSSALLKEHPDCPYLLVAHAVLIQLQDPAGEHTLEEAEASLIRAHATDNNYLPAVEELALFYYAVRPDAAKARVFAREYIRRNGEIVERMHAILEAMR